jgi:hypothetical protein
MVKNKYTMGLFIYHDDLNSTEFLVEVISNVLGYHYTQAAQCAHYITSNGEYLVKRFASKEQEAAEAIYELVTKQGIPTKLLPL